MRRNSDGSSPKSSTATSDGVVSRSARSSFRVLSNCLRVISSSASTVARSAASAASSAVNRDSDSLHDQVLWAGFDKLQKQDGYTRRVLLLAFQSGFQVWDVEDTENVHVIVSTHDGPAFFMQMLPNPINSNALDDSFFESRPLLAVCGDNSLEDNNSSSRRSTSSSSDNLGSGTVATPTNVYVYSLKSQSYVRTLKFRSIVYTVRCSSRIVAVLQAAQIHCFDATTLENDYIIVTNSIMCGSLGVGCGPLAVGPRWIAYSGNRIANSSSAVFTPELITLSSSPSVAQFARDSSKQLASGLANLGDKGYKSFTKYYSEVMPNPYIPGLKSIGVGNENVTDVDSIGMVIIKDVISKNVITQFQAHKSPISALCFDPSGMLLVTASIQGHNINVFRIMPTVSSSSDVNTPSYAHLFRLQRGFTNAVIQDISFNNDSSLIVVSSSRGTSHLFEINPEREGTSPIPLSAISRIRSDNITGWVGTMSGAAAAAASGMIGSSFVGTITSTFCYYDEQSSNKNYYGSASNNSSNKTNLLVFAPSGCMTQYALRANPVGHETGFEFESGLETEGKVAVEPIRRWPIIQNKSRRETHDQHSDVYGSGTTITTVDSKSKVFPEVVRKQQSGEESWKVSGKGMARVEDKRQLFISEAELQMHLPYHYQQPLWARRNFRFQELVMNRNEEVLGGGEMEIERIRTRTIEARTRNLVPVWGFLPQSPKFEQVTRELAQGSSNITQGGGLVATLEGHGTETGLGVVHSEEGSSRSEEGETVNKECYAEEKDQSEDEDEEE